MAVRTRARSSRSAASTFVEVSLGLALGSALVFGGAFVLEVARARADDAPTERVAHRRLPLPRTEDALPVWRSARALSPLTDASFDRKRVPSNASPATMRYAVTFHHLHTHEVLPVESAERLPPDADVARFLRCRATWDARPMRPEPVVVAVRMALEHGRDRVDVISGFRSPKLNELLRKKGREVARDSRHVVGEALDFRVPGISAVELADAVTRAHVGGVGTYPVSGFVHVDVGPARRWRGR